MDKSAAFSRALLRSVFVADPLPFAGNAQLFVSLHVADPGKDGAQTSHECAFASYARQAVNRSDGSWATVDQPDGSCAIRNVAPVSFPTCTGGSETATHFAVGTALNGDGMILYAAALDAPLAISNNVRPEFGIGQLSTVEG